MYLKIVVYICITNCKNHMKFVLLRDSHKIILLFSIFFPAKRFNIFILDAEERIRMSLIDTCDEVA